MDKREEMTPVQPESVKRYTIDELFALMEPQYREYKNSIRQCIAGLTEYAAQLAAKCQEEQIPRLRDLCIEMAEFWGLAEDDTWEGFRMMEEQYGSSFDETVSAARDSGHAPEISEQTMQNILDGLELCAQEMRANGEELEDRAVEYDSLAEELKEHWQSETAALQQTMPGGESFGVESCINGLTTYAASFAVSGQEDKVLWLHNLIEDMTEFWGLDSPEQYLTTFKQTVLEASNSGQAEGLNEQNKKVILAGLERYIDEMSANDESQEPWFLECAGFLQELREQWQLISEQKTEKPDCALIGEDGNIFNLSGIAARILRENGLYEQAEELQKRIFDGTCSDYCDALRVISEYVNITEPEGYSMEIGGM